MTNAPPPLKKKVPPRPGSGTDLEGLTLALNHNSGGSATPDEIQSQLDLLDRERLEVIAELQANRRKISEINRNKTLEPETSAKQIDHLETLRRESHQKLLTLQAEIGTANRRLRQLRAQPAPATNNQQELHSLADLPGCELLVAKNYRHPPAAEHPKYPEYFLLAARDGLSNREFRKLEKSAGMLLHQAISTGIEADSNERRIPPL